MDAAGPPGRSSDAGSVSLASIVQATRLPVIADANAGYGNALNVLRTIREFERAGGKTPLVPAAELQRLGYKIVLYPSDPQQAAMQGMTEFLAHLRSRGTSDGFERMTDWKERDAVVGLAEWQAREARFLRT